MSDDPNVVIVDDKQVEGASVVVDTTNRDPDNIPGKFWIIKDDSGRASVTVTLVFVSFWATTIMYIASALNGLFRLNPEPFNVAAVSVYFIPILTLYGARKWAIAKWGDPAKGLKPE